MTTYKGIKGLGIQTTDTDPIVYAGSWASGGALNTGRKQNTGAGTQTAALSIGGTPPVGTLVEQYDGSSWTEIADLNVASRLGAGGGTSTAALDFGGYPHPSAALTTNESWNGT